VGAKGNPESTDVYAPSAEAFRGGGGSIVAGGWSIDANVEREKYIYIYIHIKRERERESEKEQGSFASQAAPVRPDISAPPFADTL